ncbi:MAG: TIGR02281 family clan AA aspartic protease [Rhizobiaceae bacterium]|nr:TIGR02281 family clan AA aspartic protease [Rhizobiaceae bacterium]
MLRKLLILGIFAGSSASVPILYQSNPDAFHNFMESAMEESAPEPKQDRQVVVVNKMQPQESRLARSSRSFGITADSSGHYRADFRLNGRSTPALIDTGATLIAINRSTARRLGINLSNSDFKHEVRTANGTTRAAAAMIDTVEVGRIRVRDVQAVVLDDNALAGTLVGMSFLSRLSGYKVEYGELVLEQ